MVQFVQQTIEAIGYTGVVFLTFLENIFPPIPSEVVIPFAGFTARQGNLSLVGIIIAGTAGAVLGALPLYYLGYWLGEKRIMALTDRYGKWFDVSGEDIQRADRWLNEQGRIAVFVCRMIPGLRSLISIPAGIAGMNTGVFLLLTTVGTAIWTSVLAWLGYVLGQNYTAIRPYMDTIGWLVAVAVFGYAARRFWRRRSRPNNKEASHRA